MQHSSPSGRFERLPCAMAWGNWPAAAFARNHPGSSAQFSAQLLLSNHAVHGLGVQHLYFQRCHQCLRKRCGGHDLDFFGPLFCFLNCSKMASSWSVGFLVIQLAGGSWCGGEEWTTSLQLLSEASADSISFNASIAACGWLLATQLLEVMRLSRRLKHFTLEAARICSKQ